MTVRIRVEDPVDCRILRGEDLVFPSLSYRAETYRKVQRGGKFVPKRKSLIRHNNKGEAHFLAGLLPRVRDYCETNDIRLEVENPLPHLEPTNEPRVEGKALREGRWGYQYDLIKACTEHQRGVIKSATGSGKTVMMLGLMSCYPDARVLFLSNSHTPISQFEKGLEASGLTNRIDISTIQSFHRKKPKEYVDAYDVIIIDEVHEGARSARSMYAKVLRNSLAPMRLGFTATLPDKEGDRLVMEGLLGPVIGELTMREGMDRGVLAKPRVVIAKLPENSKLREYRNYRDAYEYGVVTYRPLNRRIVLDAIEDAGRGPVLILVTEIRHGEEIVAMAKSLYDLNFVLVKGDVKKEDREITRRMMIDGEIDVVVATAVFKKALDVPNLASVILGFGGKSDSQTIQAAGRGARNVDGTKGEFIFRDYFNPSNDHLVRHFGYRMCLYIDERWEITYPPL